jgi:tRNA (guanine-N7-)-methyltransferase
MSPDITHPRSIRSFVLRNSRMTAGQKKALEHHWPDYGIELQPQLPDLDRAFKRRAPRVLDIGTGMGDTTIEMARKRPDLDFLAVEVHQPGVGNLLRRAHEERLANVRIISADILEVLAQDTLINAFDTVLILFPDPWPKKRHHKRRLIKPAFLRSLLPCMRPHGRLYIATDWLNYADHILEVCEAHPALENLAGPGRYAPRPLWRPATKFETRGLDLGHEVRDFAFRVRPAA